MKPVKLEFCGLNSFSERAQIDFEPLLAGGIFGIFGETGSGKTTILDAINFALYGDIERNPDKLDKINFNCEELWVNFTFDIQTEGERKSYSVERSIKRKSGTHKAMLYERSSVGSRAVADNVKTVNDAITDIIGIGKEDFRKCIALPQGEFAQFVNSLPSERIELIERLFSLEKYGSSLRDKLARSEREAAQHMSMSKGKLSAYVDVSEEKLKASEDEIVLLEADAERLKAASLAAAKEYDGLARLYEERQAFEKAEKNYFDLAQKKPWYEEVGKVLPVLSYCERAAACAAEADELLRRVRELDGQIAEAEARQELLKSHAEEAQREYSDGNLDSAFEDAQKSLSAMQSLLSYVKLYDERERELETCREEYKKQGRVVEDGKALRKKLEEKRAEANKKLAAMPEADMVKYFEREFKGGILKNEYGKLLVYFKDFEDSIRPFADGSALYSCVSSELKRKSREYADLILTLKDAHIDVSEELKKFNEQVRARRAAEKELNDIESENKRIDSTLQKDAERLTELKERGLKLAAERDSIKVTLGGTFGEGCSDYRAAIAAAEKTKDKLAARRKELNDRIASIGEQSGQNAVRLAAAREARTIAQDSAEKAKKDCAAEVKKSGLADVAQCRELIERYSGYANALEDYNNFSRRFAAAEAEYSRYDGGRLKAVTAEQTQAALQTKQRAEDEFRRCSEILAVARGNLKTLSDRLEKRREVERELASVTEEYDLIGKLRSLISGNKFMEYIANEHLVNISRAASKTLIELTDGRYFLEYAENNFWVGDNYNGGERRKVKTLSGGETFLVSLSLALALGSTICSRSLKSIEFFFLDEGFGTLDGDLIEVVLGALEKLKSANFCIGLISHVGELQHRISSKIFVSKATESHGSTIKISC